jgi:hypothetical protein
MFNPTVNVIHVFSKSSHWLFDQTLADTDLGPGRVADSQC